METTIDKDYSENESKKSNAIVLTLVLLMLVAAAFYFFIRQDSGTTDSSKTVEVMPTQPKEQVGQEKTAKFPQTVPSSFEAVDQPAEDSIDEIFKAGFVMPELDQSDAFIHERAPSFSNHSDFPSWLVPEQLIRKFTLLVDNVSRGDLPRKSFSRYAPKKKFQAYRTGLKGYVMAEQSYQRYNLLTTMIDSLDSAAIVAVYKKLQPLFQQAYEELGYPDKDFNQTLLSATDMILMAPVMEGKITLSRPSVMYKFADKKLQRLNQVHKQMIRMGPGNSQKIQAKVREIAELVRGEQAG